MLALVRLSVSMWVTAKYRESPGGVLRRLRTRHDGLVYNRGCVRALGEEVCDA